MSPTHAILRKPQEGFTLIELLLSLAIFSIIGLATVKEVRQVQMTKEIAFKKTSSVNAIRTASAIIDNDISQAFHVRFDDLGKDTLDRLRENIPTARTVFDGRQNEVVFTALSRRIYYAGVFESEQTEISYFLEKVDGSELFNLMKREAPFIDDNLYEGGNIITILTGIEALQFEYWDKRTEKWVTDWNSDAGEFRDRFPEAMRMAFTISTPAGPLTTERLFKISFPNNVAYVAEF